MKRNGKTARSFCTRYHVFWLLLLLMPESGCTEDPPPTPLVSSLEITSLLSPTAADENTRLELSWVAELHSTDDSVSVEAVELSAPNRLRQIAMLAPNSGSLRLLAGDVGFREYRLRVKTKLSGLIRETETITLQLPSRYIRIVSPRWGQTFPAEGSLELQWVCFGIPDEEPLRLFIRKIEGEPWEHLMDVEAGRNSVHLGAEELQRRQCEILISTVSEDARAISPRIVIKPTTGEGMVSVLNLHPGDTLIYHEGILRWTSTKPEVQIGYSKKPQNSIFGRYYETTVGEVSLMEIIKHEPPSDQNITYYIQLRAVGDTHIVSVGPLYIYDFRFMNRLENKVLHRGSELGFPSRHSTFAEKPHPSSIAARKPCNNCVTFDLSTDGGATWAAYDNFSDYGQRRLLDHPASSQCYLRMRASAGRYDFEDITGPFEIDDNTTAMFEWKAGETYRYRMTYMQYLEKDSLRIEVMDRVDTPDSIVYRIREIRHVNDTSFHTITEYPTEMHRLSGWRLPDIPVYRYGHKDISQYTVFWSYGGDDRAYATVRRGIGLSQLYFTFGVPPDKRYQLDAIP